MSSKILFNDFQRQWQDIGHDVLEAVERVGKSGWLILGEAVKNFENELANLWQLPYAIGCANGLDAIEIALKCLGLQPGDLVLTTPLSAFATTLAIVRAGGVPVFVDVDDSGLIDLDLCEKIFSQDSAIRYFVPVHLYGHALNLQRLRQLKRKYKLKVVEDCAQAIGAKSKDTLVGTVGDIAITSFYPTKNLGAMGDGGALLVKTKKHERLAKSLRDYGQSKKYIHDHVGLNSRLDELQAAILHDALLPRLNDFIKRRCHIAQRYLTEIKNPNLLFVPIPKDSRSVWHLFPVLLKNSKQRTSFQQHLVNCGVASALHYPKLISDQTALKKIGKVHILSSLQCAKAFSQHQVSLPIHPYLQEEEVSRVIEACNSWAAE